MNKRPLIASPPWTAADDARLRALAMTGERPAVIAEELQRSAVAVRHRFYNADAALPPPGPNTSAAPPSSCAFHEVI